MVKTVLAEEFILKYLSHLSKDNACAIGLILGQSCLNKYNVIHFTKTPPFQPEEDKREGRPINSIKSISEVNEHWIADHARHATRMLPGGMYVLGIFLITVEDFLSPFSAKIKSILRTINELISNSSYLYGSGDNEKVVFQYNPKTQKYYAKTYDVVSSNVQTVDCKFISKANKWSILECRFEIDQSLPLKGRKSEGPLKNHIKLILENISSNLENAIILFDGEFKTADDCLENIGKKRGKVLRGFNRHTEEHEENNKSIQVSIFQLCDASGDSQECFEVCEIGGQIRIVGEVVSKLWLNPKMSVGDASKAVVQDIMRSLSTRLEMHWDSLTEEEHAEDVNSVHEPPRRVLITLPDSNIDLSDYLFPGEGPDDVKLSLEEIMDIKSEKNLPIQEVEAQADINQYYNGAVECENEEILPKMPAGANEYKYYIGVVIALIVLLIAALIPFIYSVFFI